MGAGSISFSIPEVKEDGNDRIDQILGVLL